MHAGETVFVMAPHHMSGQTSLWDGRTVPALADLGGILKLLRILVSFPKGTRMASTGHAWVRLADAACEQLQVPYLDLSFSEHRNEFMHCAFTDLPLKSR